MDGGAWWTAVHGVARSWTRLCNFQVDNLSDFTFTFHFHALEKEMATHSSVLAWRIPGTGESGGLLSLGSHRVWHDWSDLAAAAVSSISCLFDWSQYKILNTFTRWISYKFWLLTTNSRSVFYMKKKFFPINIANDISQFLWPAGFLLGLPWWVSW